MKYLLLLAAVVLHYMQVLHASPYSSIQYSSGGPKTTRTASTIALILGSGDNNNNEKKNVQTTTSTYEYKFGDKDGHGEGDGAQKWHSQWHYGNSDRTDDDDDNKIKVGHNGQTTTTTTAYVYKVGDKDDNAHGNNCEDVLKQLQAANAEIALLKQQNKVLSSQISNKETECNTQILVFKNVIHKWTEDYTLLENKVNVIIAESQTWKSKYEITSVTLKQVQQINIQLEINLKQTQTTVITLQKNIEQIKTNTKSNDKELIELKHKYEILFIESDNCKKQVKELTNSNTDYTKTIKEITEKLTTSQNDGHQLSIDLINIKNILEVTKKNMAGCELDKAKLKEELKIQINEYNADELRDHEELMLRKKIEADLEHYRAQITEIEKNYKSEKTNVLNCKNEIIVIREEYTKIIKKYENDIKIIQTSIDQCQASLKIEVDLKNSLVIENKKYVLQITEIEYQLTVTQKTVIEAQSQTKLCQDDANNLKSSIEVFKHNIAETTNLLQKCGDSSTSIQIELTSCKSNNLEEFEEIIRKSETRITELQTENSSLVTGKKRCEGDLSSLRCDINKHLAADRKSETAIPDALLLVLSIYDNTKAAINKFVSTHDLTCVKSN